MYLIDLLLMFSAKFGYFGVVFLMAIESSFIPFPSEIIIPPAAYLASQGEMNIYLVVVSGITGSLIGACINYWLAMTLGRKIIYALVEKKIFKLLMINRQKIEYAEKYFRRYGNMSTLVGRLVFAVRQLISIPAGFSRMNFKNFIIYTTIGSGLWTIILALFGYLLGANKEAIGDWMHAYKLISLALVGLVLLAAAILTWRNYRKKKAADAATREIIENINERSRQ